MKPIILDNSVLVDIILASEDRSGKANMVYECIKSNNFEIFLPCFALFEIKSAISNKKINTGSVDLRSTITEDDPLVCKFFAIDEAFVTRHLGSGIGYLKAGDYVYVCLAKQENGILITEDNKQYRVSKDAGIETYKLDEFVNQYS